MPIICLVGPVICDSFWLKLVVLAIDCLWWLLIRMSGFTQISVKIIVLLSSSSFVSFLGVFGLQIQQNINVVIFFSASAVAPSLALCWWQQWLRMDFLQTLMLDSRSESVQMLALLILLIQMYVVRCCQMLFLSVLLLYLYPILVSYIWAAFTSVSHIGEWVPAATEENLFSIIQKGKQESCHWRHPSLNIWLLD